MFSEVAYSVLIVYTKELKNQSWATSKGLEYVCSHSHTGVCGNACSTPGSVITMLEWHFTWLNKLYFWAGLPLSIPRASQPQNISFLYCVTTQMHSLYNKEWLRLWTVGILRLKSCWKCVTLRKSWPWGHAGRHHIIKEASDRKFRECDPLLANPAQPNS